MASSTRRRLSSSRWLSATPSWKTDIEDFRFAALRWLVSLFSCLFVLNWLTLPAALNLDEASETQAVVKVVHARGVPRLSLDTDDFGSVSLDCFATPALCQSPQLRPQLRPRLRSGEPVRVWLQWTGLAHSAWLVKAEVDGVIVADPASQDQAYRKHKWVLGGVSLLACAFTALLMWAGPFRSASESPPSSNFWS
jgi:hypothetical protein